MKKQTARQVIVEATMRTFAHQNTVVIDSRRRVVECDLNETELSIAALSTALTNARRRAKQLEATLEGMDAVIRKR